MTRLTLPAQALRASLLSGETTAADLLDEALARLDAVNPTLNAVVAENRAAARLAARESDARIASGEARPLEGLPVTVKDAFDAAGLPNTSGAPAYKDRVPDADAPAVARLRAAGAVILGKTLVPAFCGDFQAFNGLHGTGNNPYDLTRSPGGSSGGAAAAVASGISAFELGSDFGGSIRWPAHACGIFGHKPTFGLVSTRGHVPPPPGMQAESDFAVAGPLARSARDLAPILDVIMGPPAQDGHRPRLEPPRVPSPRGLRVALWADDPFCPVDAPVREAAVKAAEALQAAGAEVDAGARPDFAFEDMFEAFGLFNHAIIASGLPQALRDKLAASAASFAPDDRSHRALQARGARLDARLWGELQERRRAYRAAWARFFERFDVLLCPPAPVPAIPHDHQGSFHARMLQVNGATRPYFDFLVWSSLATLPGLPATVAPCLSTPEGLPSGVQIVGAEGMDLTTIAVAEHLEDLGCRYAPPAL